MKKSIALLCPFLLSLLTGCPGPTATPEPSDSSYPYYSSTPYPSYSPTITPQATASVVSLDSLQAGVLPDTSFTDEERKLAGVLIRKTTPVFPLKIGVLLYRGGGSLPDSERKKDFDDFIAKLKENPNVGQVIEISSSLIRSGASIDDIRKIGSQFQVSSVLIISENYPYPVQNNEAVVTPIDQITGARTWESFSNIEVYCIDVLNGVFIFSTAAGAKESDKYIRNNNAIENTDNTLIKNSAFKAWNELKDKVSNEITDYKNRFDADKIIPVILSSQEPLK